jgi:hypothetical protein
LHCMCYSHYAILDHVAEIGMSPNLWHTGTLAWQSALTDACAANGDSIEGGEQGWHCHKNANKN